MKLILTALILSVSLAGCSSPTGTNTSGIPSPAQPATPLAADPTASPVGSPGDEGAGEGSVDFEGTAGNTLKENPGAPAATLLRSVRSAGHSNYDRVVFEFEGAQIPSYKIEYIDKPVRACGSGNVVPFAGDAWLSVLFTGANAHTEAGEPTIKDRTRSPNHNIVKDLKLICDFEAEVEWVLGVASPNKYRVLELKNPTRLVVDIKHNR